MRLLSTGARPAAVLTPFFEHLAMLGAGPRAEAREHSVPVQLFAAASRLMVIAFECDAVSWVMMSAGKPKYVGHNPKLSRLSADSVLVFGAASWRSSTRANTDSALVSLPNSASGVSIDVGRQRHPLGGHECASGQH